MARISPGSIIRKVVAPLRSLEFRPHACHSRNFFSGSIVRQWNFNYAYLYGGKVVKASHWRAAIQTALSYAASIARIFCLGDEMNVKRWMDGVLKHLPLMGDTQEQAHGIFDHCDLALEDDPYEQGWVSILANSAGRNAVEDLFPDLPIKWHRSPLFPGDWATADLFVSRMVEMSDAHKLPKLPFVSRGTESQIVRRLARGAIDVGCRVGLKSGQKYSLISQTS